MGDGGERDVAEEDDKEKEEEEDEEEKEEEEKEEEESVHIWSSTHVSSFLVTECICSCLLPARSSMKDTSAERRSHSERGTDTEKESICESDRVREGVGTDTEKEDYTGQEAWR